MGWNEEEQAAEDAAREAMDALLAAQDARKVLEARAAYLWAVSPSVATAEWEMNISGAARVMGSRGRRCASTSSPGRRWQRRAGCAGPRRRMRSMWPLWRPRLRKSRTVPAARTADKPS